jgi:carboxyl-terminal processing protease
MAPSSPIDPNEPERAGSSRADDAGLPGHPTDSIGDGFEPEEAFEQDLEAEVRPASRPRSNRSVAPSRFGLIIAATLAGSALFVGGFTLGQHVASTPGTPASEESRFQSFWDVYQLIQKDFAGSPKPSQDQLVQGAIKGMLEALNDQWSYYQEPEDFASSLQNVGGQAEGIGVQVTLQPVDATSTVSCSAIGNGCELAVVKPIPGSPAESQGVLAGDIIVSVDGTSLDGKTLDQATSLIRGDVGTSVTIGLLRDGRSISISIVRAVFNQPEITTRTLANGKVAYIAISGVNDVAASQFHDALAAALDAGQTSIVLDLRGNPGGYVESAEKIASEFIPDGALAYQQDSAGNQSSVDATPGGLATDPSIKVVVLVDGNTASAAEIIAGALQARHRGILIGSKTFGKGVVQAWLPLPDNFGGIHLTVARWLTPDKVWIQGTGLQPDVPVDTSNARAGTDPVLDAALTNLGFAPEPAPSNPPAEAPSASPSTAPGPTPAPTPAASAS